MPRTLLSSIVVIAIAAVVLGGTGCRSNETPAASPSPTATGSVEASSAENSGASSSTSGPSSSDTPKTAPARPLDEPEAAKLEAELSAIEKELESMDLPGDSDLKDIEGALE